MINEEKDREPNLYYKMFTDEVRVGIEDKDEQLRKKEWNMKQCTGCGEYKSDSEFYKCNQAKDGLQFWCKNCCYLSNNLRYKLRIKNGTSEKK